MKYGRPTKYKDEYCDMLIDHMRQGLSFECFAGVIGVTPECIYNWARENEAFSEAKSRGFVLCQLFWEKIGIAGVTGRIQNFQTGAWIFNMKHRFKWYEASRHLPEGTRNQLQLAYSQPSKKFISPEKKGQKRIRTQKNTNALIAQGHEIIDV